MKTLIILSATAFLLFAFQATTTSAETWYILPDGSGDAPNIQWAMYAASPGDVIELADGTFTGPGNRDIDYRGKAITVRSQSGNPEACVIDCEGSPSSLHRGFYFHMGEGVLSILEGITITGGYRNLGGGIYCNNSSPTIRGNIIRNNYSNDADGGGIFCLNSAASIMDNLIQNNTSPYDGGGIAIVYSNGTTVSENTITGNQANSGGGISCFDSSPTISNNGITDNLAQGGGGIHCAYSDNPNILDNIINRNTAYEHAGGISLFDSNPTVIGNTVCENTAGGAGGAMFFAYSSGPLLISNTISGNSASVDGGGISLFDSNPTLEQCIVSYNNAPIAAIFCNSGSSPVLTCCDLFGNIGGDWIGCISDQIDLRGNFSAPPCFCDDENGDYHLCADSWCLPENHPWGCDDLVGAYGEGCGACECPSQGPVPTVVTTWGGVKVLYR